MPGVKNQHYVLRFYLKSFTDDAGHLSVVRLASSPLRHRQPAKDGTANRLITVPVSCSLSICSHEQERYSQ